MKKVTSFNNRERRLARKLIRLLRRIEEETKVAILQLPCHKIQKKV